GPPTPSPGRFLSRGEPRRAASRALRSDLLGRGAPPSPRKGLLDPLDRNPRGVAPETLEVEVVAFALGEHVDEEIAVVHQDPFPFSVPLDARPEPFGPQTPLDGVGDRLRLA